MRGMQEVRWMMLAVLTAACVSTPHPAAEAEIATAEAQLAEAFTRQDVAAIDRLWSDDFIFTFPSGKVFTKQQRLAGMKPLPADAKPSLINKNDSIVIHVYGDCAVAAVLSSWRPADASTGDQYQATHVWIRQSGHWRLVAAQVAQIKKP